MTRPPRKRAIGMPIASGPRSARTIKDSGKTREQLLSVVAMKGMLSNGNTAQTFAQGSCGKLDAMQCFETLMEQVTSVQGGDLSDLEAVLVGQATALNAIFNECARCAAHNVGTNLPAMELYMRLSLKAQSQCRSTIVALAEIKNPSSVAFVRQANIAHGPQQVNNHVDLPRARAEEIETRPNELLEHDHEQRLDTGAKAAASGSYQAVEAVGEVKRPAQRRRKGDGQQ